jgi:hypothetical protein
MLRILLLASALAVPFASTAAAQTDTVPPKCGKDAGRADFRHCNFDFRPLATYRVDLVMAGIARFFFDPDDDVAVGGIMNPDPEGFKIGYLANMMFIQPLKKDRIGRVFVLTVNTVDKKTGEKREHDLEVNILDEEHDGAVGRTRYYFTYPGRAEAKAIWQRQDAQRQRAEADKARRDARRRPPGEAEQDRASAILAVAHHYGPRNTMYMQQVEPGSAGERLLQDMVARGFEVANTDKLTIVGMPEGMEGLAVHTYDADGSKIMAPPIPKRGTWVIPRVAHRLSFTRGDAVFCLYNVGPTLRDATGTGTISPRVTVRPRMTTADLPR